MITEAIYMLGDRAVCTEQQQAFKMLSIPHFHESDVRLQPPIPSISAGDKHGDMHMWWRQSVGGS